MTPFTLFRNRALGPAILVGVGLTLMGCANSAPKTSSTTTTASRATGSTVAKRGSGGGHWVDVPSATTGSYLRRRIWVPDGTSDADAIAKSSDDSVQGVKPGVKQGLRSLDTRNQGGG